MLLRRMLLLVAALLLIATVAASLAPEEEPPESGLTAEPTGDVALVEATLSTDAEGQSITASAGDRIRFEVEGDVLDSVLIERLDRIDAIEPSTPARFDLIVDDAGVYPIRLIEADRRIGRLDVSP